MATIPQSTALPPEGPRGDRDNSPITLSPGWRSWAAGVETTTLAKIVAAMSFAQELRHGLRARLHVKLFVDATDIVPHRVDTDA